MSKSLSEPALALASMAATLSGSSQILQGCPAKEAISEPAPALASMAAPAPFRSMTLLLAILCQVTTQRVSAGNATTAAPVPFRNPCRACWQLVDPMASLNQYPGNTRACEINIRSSFH
jgi:hypothetical protein